MRFPKILLCLFLLQFFLSPVFLQADSCDTPPPGPPGNDNADDNASFATYVNENTYSLGIEAKILVLRSGYYKEALSLLNRLAVDTNDFDGHAYFPEASYAGTIVFLPTGSLAGKEGDEILRQNLKSLVERGATIICLAQNYGSAYDLLPRPEGQPWRCSGWRESQSCTHSSAYAPEMRAIFAGCSSQVVDMGIDSNFSHYPEGAEVLLRRTANNEAAMIAYNYGAGKVIVSGQYTDWGVKKSQASQTEVKVLANLLAYAASPFEPIAMIPVDETSSVPVNLGATLKNTGKTTATRAKIKVMNPAKTRTVFQTEANLALQPGGETQVNLDFNVTPQPQELGIWHTVYSLYDENNDLVKVETESTSARFALYKTPEAYSSSRELDVWITSDSEEYGPTQIPVMTAHFRNNGDSSTGESREIALELQYDWTHSVPPTPLGAITVPAGAKVEKVIHAPIRYVSSGGIRTFWLHYREQGQMTYKKVRRGVRKVPAATWSRLYVDYWSRHSKVGAPIPYEILCKAKSNFGPGPSTITLDLEKRGEAIPDWPYYQYQPLGNVKTFSADLVSDGPFQTSGAYTPDAPIGPGSYRFKLTVTRPDNGTETRYRNFYYSTSDVTLTVDDARDTGGNRPDHLTVNGVYSVEAKVHNSQFCDVEQGALTLSMLSGSGVEVFRKEVTGIHLPKSTTRTVGETFTFVPPVPGHYYFRARYSDETGKTLTARGVKLYKTGIHMRVAFEKESVSLGETIRCNVEARGIGDFVIHVQCPAAGYTAQRPVTLTPAANHTLQPFDIPYTGPLQPGGLEVTAQMVSQSPQCGDTVGVCRVSASDTVPAAPLVFQLNGTFDTLSPNINAPLRLNLEVRGISGFVAPVPASVRVRSSALGFDTARDLAVSPGTPNPAGFDIPLPALPQPGDYTVEALFTGPQGQTLSRTFSFTLPPARLEFTPPPSTAGAGETVTLTVTNNGGRDGEFQVETGLTGPYGNPLVKHTQTLTLAAGQQLGLPIIVPPSAASGNYTLHALGRPVPGNDTFSAAYPLVLSGVETTLEAATGQDTYYYDQTVTAGAQVFAGPLDTGGGTLHASVVKATQENHLKTFSPGRFMEVNLIDSAFYHNQNLYTIGDGGLVRAPLTGGETEVLDPLETLNLRFLLHTSEGETWGASNTGVHCRDTSGTWRHYSSADGLTGQWITHITATPGGGTRVWVASRGGVSVFDGASGSWQTYTTAHGLPDNYAYRVAMDQEGSAWVSTSGGLCRRDGAQFVPAGAPFGDTPVKEHFTSTSDGTLWAAVKQANDDYTLYKRSGETWETFELNTLHAPYRVTLWQMSANGSRLWLHGTARDQQGENSHRVLFLYDEGWTPYNGFTEPLLEGLDYFAAVPGSGGGTDCFISEAGYLLYENGGFSHRFIQQDAHMLPGTVTCLEKDPQDRLWVGTTRGLSLLDASGAGFVNTVTTSTGQALGEVYRIAAGPDNSVYALADCGLVKISGALVENLPPPENDTDFIYSPGYVQLAVDLGGRPWTGYRNLYTHDGGQWTRNQSLQTVRALEPDTDGGMWVFSYNSSYIYQLSHVDSLGGITGYTSNDSPLPYGSKNQLYLHEDGVLFILGDSSLQSFHPGSGAWIDYGPYDGFPSRGLHALTAGEQGKILLLGTTPENDNRVYTLEGNVFQPGETNFYALTYGSADMESLRGVTYTYGGNTGGGDGEAIAGAQLLALSGTPGWGEQELWTGTFPAVVPGGNQLDITLPVNQTLPAGNYLLKARLLSSLDQPLASDIHPFTVRDRNLSAALLPGGGFKGTLKKGDTLPISIDLFNDTGATEAELLLSLTALSPSGTETPLLQETLALAPSQRETFSLDFTGTEPGAWRLRAQLYRPGGGGGGGEGEGEGEQPFSPAESTGTPAAQSELLLQIAEPVIQLDLDTPAEAGISPFDISVTLTNTGAVPAEVQTSLATGGPSGEQQHTAAPPEKILQPGESLLLTFRETIGKDTQYTLIVGGDVSIQRDFTISYGIAESLSVTVPPSAREGIVTLPVSIGNSGSLPFTDTLHLEVLAPGNSTPFYSFDKDYTLLPGRPAINDTLQCPLPPGNYLVSYHTQKHPGQSQRPLTVQPSGLPRVTVPAVSFPTGGIHIPIHIANIDSHPGLIPLTIQLSHASSPGTPIHTEERRIFLQPSETRTEHLALSLPAPGTYTLTVAGPRLPVPFQTTLHIRAPQNPAAQVTVGEIAAGTLPVHLVLQNNGFLPFNGTLSVHMDNRTFQLPVQAQPGLPVNIGFPLDLSVISPGGHPLTAVLIDAAGNIISQTQQVTEVRGPDIGFSEVPQDLSCDAGGYVSVPLALENRGHHPGGVNLSITAFDSLSQQWDLLLQPGETTALEDLVLDAPADLPDGRYPIHYRLSGAGIPGGLTSGSFYVTVNGLSVTVDAQLDRGLYRVGETAQLTLTPETNGAGTAAPLEVVVNWGNFHEKRTFVPGASMDFFIPLEEAREDKIFYGIYHQGGKGLYLNDVYIHFQDTLGVETDKQLYAPGDVIQAVFVAGTPGVLTAECFGESFTLPLAPSASASFQAPEDIPGGTYGISWSFSPNDTAQNPVSGAHRFDVAGLVVKVAEARLEQGNYRPGDGVNAFFRVEANGDTGLDMRHWFVSPSGDSHYLGERALDVSASAQKEVTAAFPFIPIDAEAGTYEWVYGIYGGENLLASGRLAFHCGEVVLMGITVEEEHYPNGNETVRLWADVYGEGSGQLDLLLDGEPLESRTVSAGTGGAPATARTEFQLSPSVLMGGYHTVTARLTVNADALVSLRQTDFDYGTRLPDLAPEISSSGQQQLDYTYTIAVLNRGKTSSASAVLEFGDNGQTVATRTVPPLQPGEAHEELFPWNGGGKAGEHVLRFEVDPGNSIKEYRETNNTVETLVDVPVLFHGLVIDPASRPAHADVPVKTLLTNNRGTAVSVTLHLVVEAETGGVPLFERTRQETLAPFEARTLTDTFNTGIHPPGGYRVTQSAVSGDGTVELEAVTLLVIETTRALTGRLDIVPDRVPAHTPTPVQLRLTIKNSGNVPLENETLDMEIAHRDTGDLKLTGSWPVTLAPGEETPMEKEIHPDLEQGIYDVAVTFETFETSAELTVVPSIAQEKNLGLHPRVLVTDLRKPGKPCHGAGPWERLLTAARIEHMTVTRVPAAYRQWHGGHFSVHVVRGRLPGETWLKELRARVWNGEGLIFLCDTPARAPKWTAFLGVKAKPVPKKQRETSLVIPAGRWSGGGAAELPRPHSLRLDKAAPDVTVTAHTQRHNHAVMAYRRYGRGHILVMTVPPPGAPGPAGPVGPVEQLLLNVVRGFASDIYSGSDLTRLLPVEMVLTNRGSEEKQLTVTELLPYGVEAHGFRPQPEEPVEGEPFTWNLTIPAGESRAVSYWAKLPDQVGQYVLTSEIVEGDTRLGEVELSFEVLQTVTGRLDELLAEAALLRPAGSDGRWMDKVLRRLEAVRARVGGGTETARQNLIDMAGAADALGRVKGADVSNMRRKVIDVMNIMGRRFYEEVSGLPLKDR